MNVKDRITNLYKLADKKKQVLENLEKERFKTDPIVKWVGSDNTVRVYDLRKENVHTLTNIILPYLISVVEVNTELEKNGIPLLKVNGCSVDDIIKDTILAINKNNLPNLKQSYFSLLHRINSIAPEDMLVARELDDISNEYADGLEELNSLSE